MFWLPPRMESLQTGHIKDLYNNTYSFNTTRHKSTKIRSLHTTIYSLHTKIRIVFTQGHNKIYNSIIARRCCQCQCHRPRPRPHQIILCLEPHRQICVWLAAGTTAVASRPDGGGQAARAERCWELGRWRGAGQQWQNGWRWRLRCDSKWNWVHEEGIRALIRNRYEPRLARYIHQLTNEDTTTYVHQLTNKYTGPIFVNFLYFHQFMYRGI
jgi:hypothetical protein